MEGDNGRESEIPADSANNEDKLSFSEAANFPEAEPACVKLNRSDFDI
jgi:hypothetical protein